MLKKADEQFKRYGIYSGGPMCNGNHGRRYFQEVCFLRYFLLDSIPFFKPHFYRRNVTVPDNVLIYKHPMDLYAG